MGTTQVSNDLLLSSASETSLQHLGKSSTFNDRAMYGKRRAFANAQWSNAQLEALLLRKFDQWGQLLSSHEPPANSTYISHTTDVHPLGVWKGLNQLSSTELCDHVTSSLPNTVVTVTKTNIDARHSDGIPRDQLGAAEGWTDIP